MKHSDRKHSKFSASGSERWFNCSGSVALSEGIPSKETPAGVEGTRAHEVLEMLLGGKILKANFVYTLKMIEDGLRTVDFLNGLCREHPEAEFMVETRIYLDFIHPEMFGTFDSGIVELFGTLHVIDYKYGKYMVNPKNNLQMLFYAIGLAHKYHWNFKKVRMWIIQPRAPGYDGPIFWEISIEELRAYVEVFRKAVKKVETHPEEYTEGKWCHFCVAKKKCPLKQEGKLEKSRAAFMASPFKR